MGDERSQQLDLLFFTDRSVDAGGEDNGDIARPYACFNQSPHQQVDDLRAAGCPRRVRNDDQDGVAGRHQLFKQRRTDRGIESRVDFRVRQGRPVSCVRFQHFKAGAIVLKIDGCLPVT